MLFKFYITEFFLVRFFYYLERCVKISNVIIHFPLFYLCFWEFTDGNPTSDDNLDQCIY